MEKKLNLFIPITKIDAEKRLVYGVATAEQVDRSGEVCDYASTKPLYEKWSAAASEVTNGKSLGNVRAMHGNVAAGKLTQIEFNDADKQIEVCAKVVDDAEWIKVSEGVYTGFSQGGDYVSRWKDEADGLIHYTADPVEISLVDLPCLPSATFSYIKAAGAVETRHFKAEGATVFTNAQITAKAEELAKAAGDATLWPTFIEAANAALVAGTAAASAPVAKGAEAEPEKPAAPTAEAAPVVAEVTAEAAPVIAEKAVEVETVAPAEPAPEWRQVWETADGKTFKNKADARAHAAELKKAAPADALDTALGALNAALTGTAAPAPAITSTEALAAAVAAFPGVAKGSRYVARRAIIKAALDLGTADTLPAEIYKASPKPEAEALAKSISLYGLSNLLNLLACIEDAEESLEYDSYWGGVNAPDELKTKFGQLVVDLGNVIAEALDVILAAMNDEETTEALARAAGPLALVKAGARHSRADREALKAAHDAIVKLGAECNKGVEIGELAKGLGVESPELAKQVDALKTDNAKLSEGLAKAVEGITKATEQIRVLGAEVQKLNAQPANGGPPRMSVLSENVVSTAVAEAALAEAAKAISKGDAPGAAMALIKGSQSAPMRVPDGYAAMPAPRPEATATIVPAGGPAATPAAKPAAVAAVPEAAAA